MNDSITDQERDQAFLSVKTIQQNKYCIDCQKKNPSWCSIYFGIHICMDCAGKHRQYGPVYSFVKSATLDVWTKRQIQFMLKGGNARALQYFRKCGVIGVTNKTIDYKSAIVQKYKQLLTSEVDGNSNNLSKQIIVQQKKIDSLIVDQVVKQKQTNLQNNAEQIKQETTIKKGKGKKKIQATKINIEQFDNIQFDNGISKAQQDAMIRASENALTLSETNNNTSINQLQSINISNTNSSQTAKVEAPKAMDIQTAKQALDKLKEQQQRQNKNIKALSSADFEDKSSTPSIQHNLSKLEGKQGFGSSDVYGRQPEQQTTADKIKNVISNVGQKLYDKFSKYIKK